MLSKNTEGISLQLVRENNKQLIDIAKHGVAKDTGLAYLLLYLE